MDGFVLKLNKRLNRVRARLLLMRLEQQAKDRLFYNMEEWQLWYDTNLARRERVRRHL